MKTDSICWVRSLRAQVAWLICVAAGIACNAVAAEGLYFQSGVYVGNDSPQGQTIPLVNEADMFVVGALDAAEPYALGHKAGWFGKPFPLFNAGALHSSARLRHDRIEVVNGDDISHHNRAGVHYHWHALEDPAGRHVVCGDWAGNTLASRTLSIGDHEIEFIEWKRENKAVKGVFASPHFGAQLADGTEQFNGIRIEGNRLTLAPNDNHFNWWFNGAGESTSFMALMKGPHVQVSRYKGTGAPRTVRTKFRTLQVVRIIKLNAAHSPTLWQPTLPAGSHIAMFGKEAGGTGRITAVAGGDITLSADANVNGLDAEYALVAIGDCEPAVAEPARPLKSNARLRLGAGAYVDCGTAGHVDGAFTLQWVGTHDSKTVPPWREEPSSDAWSPLVWRGAGADDTEGNVNWGMQMGGNAWGVAPLQGLWVVVHDHYNQRGAGFSPDAQGWQTGVAPEPDRLVDIILSHDGLGGWQIFIDGRLEKYRNLDCLTMTKPGPRPNIKGRPDHRLIYGGRVAAGGVQQTARTTELHSCRLWNRCLTRAEARQASLSKYQGQDDAPRAGLVFEHLASRITRSTLPDSSGNHAEGEIKGGVVVTTTP